MSTSVTIKVNNSEGGRLYVMVNGVVVSGWETDGSELTFYELTPSDALAFCAEPDDGWEVNWIRAWHNGAGSVTASTTSDTLYITPTESDTSIIVSADFSETSTDSGSSGSGGDEDSATWGIQYTYNISGPTSRSTYLDPYGIRVINLTPSVAMRLNFTATSNDDLVICEISDDTMDMFDDAPPRFEDSAGDEIENIDTGSSGEETTGNVHLSAGEEWHIAFWEFGGVECDVDWVITRIDDWYSPKDIVTLNGNTSYNETTEIQARRAYYVQYTTPSYTGKLVCQTISGGTTPNYYSHLASGLIDEGVGRYRDEAIDISSSYLLKSDDNGRGVGRDTKIEYICSPSTTYYWYVNAAYDYENDYTVPWSLNYYREYTLTYVSDNSTFATQKFYENDINITTIADIPTKSGYSFVGWSFPSGTYAANILVSSPGVNTTVTAVWQQQIITVDYDANGGDGAPVLQTFTTSPVTLSSTKPTRTGYDFLGWSTNPNATTASYAAGSNCGFVMPSAVILYAVWQISNYAVTYNIDGKTNLIEQQIFNVNNQIVTISSTTPTKTGYVFLGWSENSNATSASYSAGSTYSLSLKDYTLHAVWKIKTYTISYNANEGSGAISSQTKTYGTNLTLASSGFTKTGYILSHWNTQADGLGSSYQLGATYIDIGDTDITLYAIWADNTYSLIYNANGGSGGPVTDVKSQGGQWKINVTTSPTRSGYTFKGWAETATAISPLYKSKTYPTTTLTVGTSNKILYAVWWPHFEWVAQTKEYANQLVDYMATYMGITVSKVTDTTSLLYLTDWYNEVAAVLNVETLSNNTIIQKTHLQDLANAFNSY